MELAELKAARDNLKRARAAGIRSVAFGEDRVEYASDREMAAVLAAIEADIARLEGGPRSTFIRINATKGA